MASKDVFISYKAEEKEEAIWVRSVLESNGVSCWMAPTSIPGGSSYAIEIPQAIRQAKVFVLILSSRAQASQWVSREVDLAINEGKIVLPFMLENCALRDDFNFYLTNVQRYAAYENKAAAIRKMLNEIKAIIGSEENSEPVAVKEAVAIPVRSDVAKKKVAPSAENNAVKEKVAPPAENNAVKEKVAPSAENNVVKEKVAPPAENNAVKKKVAPPAENNAVKAVKEKQKYDVKSILSFVFGVVAMAALLGMFIVPNIVALVLSIVSLGSIKKKNRRGKVFAIIGQVLGLLSMLIGLTIFFYGIGFAIAAVIDIISLIIFIIKYKALKK